MNNPCNDRCDSIRRYGVCNDLRHAPHENVIGSHETYNMEWDCAGCPSCVVGCVGCNECAEYGHAPQQQLQRHHVKVRYGSIEYVNIRGDRLMSPNPDDENEFGNPEICDCESCQRSAGTWD